MRKTKKEVADMIGISTRELSVYISRSKMDCVGDMIDLSIEKNKAFLDKKMNGKGATTNLSPTSTSPIALPSLPRKSSARTRPADEADDAAGIPSYIESERLLKFLDTQKREQEVSLLKIKEEKMRGEVIPSELMKPLFLRHNQSIITAVKNGNDEILRLFSKKKGLNSNEVAEMRGEMTKILNTAMSKAADASIKEVSGIINDFSEKRGVGERI